MEAGSTVLLACVGFGDPSPSVTWSTQGIVLSNSSQITIYEELETVDGVDFVQSILAICSVEKADEGDYICSLGNALGNVSVNFELSVGGRWIIYVAFFMSRTYNVSICISPKESCSILQSQSCFVYYMPCKHTVLQYYLSMH